MINGQMVVFPDLIRDTIYFYEWFENQKKVILEYRTKLRYYGYNGSIGLEWKLFEIGWYNHRTMNYCMIQTHIRCRCRTVAYLPARYIYSSGKTNGKGYK